MNRKTPVSALTGLVMSAVLSSPPALALDNDAEDAAACVGHFSAVAQAEILAGESAGANGLEPGDAEKWRGIIRAVRGTATDDELLAKAAQSAQNTLPYALAFLNGLNEITVDAELGPENPDDYLTAMGKMCWNIEQR